MRSEQLIVGLCLAAALLMWDTYAQRRQLERETTRRLAAEAHAARLSAELLELRRQRWNVRQPDGKPATVTQATAGEIIDEARTDGCPLGRMQRLQGYLRKTRPFYGKGGWA